MENTLASNHVDGHINDEKREIFRMKLFMVMPRMTRLGYVLRILAKMSIRPRDESVCPLYSTEQS